MKLPNADQAVVDLAKLEAYVLNPQHPDGRHKARVFASTLGITLDDAPWLRSHLLTIVQNHEAVESPPIPFGRRLVIDFALETAVGAALFAVRGSSAMFFTLKHAVMLIE